MLRIVYKTLFQTNQNSSMADKTDSKNGMP